MRDPPPEIAAAIGNEAWANAIAAALGEQAADEGGVVPPVRVPVPVQPGEPGGGGPGVMIGDSTWDCEAARRCGVESIGLLTGGFSEQELLEAGASAVFESIADLIEALERTPLGPARSPAAWP